VPDLRDVLIDLAVCVATGDDRLYANVLLTVGYITPGPETPSRGQR
jgi:hypothetical protein